MIIAMERILHKKCLYVVEWYENNEQKLLVNSGVISNNGGCLSLGIDKKDMRLLPLFLVNLGKMKSVKEWLITPSSLDEVFMRIVEINRDVENADVMVQAAVLQEKHKEVHLCRICGTRVAETGMIA